jgi:CDP-glucose 4,6-dehydratase
MSLLNNFSGKKVLITGHTGFKGAWLCSWLLELGAEVVGVALDPITEPSQFAVTNLSSSIKDLRIDIRDKEALKSAFVNAKPDFVFHLAAQALVRRSYDDPIETWQTNVIGTLNVLEALRAINKQCAAVIITSDKCYDNVEWVWGYREIDAMGGPDPYSASKGAAELALKSHVKSYFPKETSLVRVASARAGNVIGGGDWSVDRIIPDCVKAWANGVSVELRNPHSTRPWQHVLEPLSGYLVQAVSLYKNPEMHGESFNFGPVAQHNHSVLDLVSEMSRHWDRVQWVDLSKKIEGPYESGLLKLNCDKALHQLNWHALMNFKETVKMTAEWYKGYYQKNSNMFDLTVSQINEYTRLAQKEGLGWAV